MVSFDFDRVSLATLWFLVNPDQMNVLNGVPRMKILVAGATGAVGQRLVPQLVDAGHTVVGTTRDPAKAAVLRDRGAEATVVDGLDRNAIDKAVRRAEPEVIVNQMTSLAGMGSNMRKFDRYFAKTNQLRTDGTANLLAAARVVGSRRFVTQSYGSWNNLRDGDFCKDRG